MKDRDELFKQLDGQQEQISKLLQEMEPDPRIEIFLKQCVSHNEMIIEALERVREGRPGVNSDPEAS